MEAIINNGHESRKEWMIRIFSEAGRNSRNTDYQFWDNQPKECYSSEFTIQNLNYIHNNPVEAGIVDRPEEYLYISAREYYNKENCGLLKIVLFNGFKKGAGFASLLLSCKLSTAFRIKPEGVVTLLRKGK
jgi:hypothetical protein